MKSPFPIPYGLNVHPGTDGSAVRRALRTHVLAVKQLVAPDRPFPLGLYLSRQATADLLIPRRLASFRQWLQDHDCFVACVNAFPFGQFHGSKVKARVYRPDWRSPERLEYTRSTAHLLSHLLPEGSESTLTTVPGGWRPDWKGRKDERLARRHLGEAAAFCRDLRERTGRRIRIAIEPEPGCAWELFDPRLEDLAPEVCWCLDTCHAAVNFRPMTRLKWNRIGRVQLSAAIECDNTPQARNALQRFVEPVYLHQTRAALHGQVIGEWDDLGPAIRALPRLPAEAVVRTHYHVPLTWTQTGPLRSTAPQQLTPAFFKQTHGTRCEVETYTHSILPRGYRPRSLAQAIAGELQWAAARQRSSSSTKRKTVSPGLA